MEGLCSFVKFTYFPFSFSRVKLEPRTENVFLDLHFKLKRGLKPDIILKHKRFEEIKNKGLLLFSVIFFKVHQYLFYVMTEECLPKGFWDPFIP